MRLDLTVQSGNYCVSMFPSCVRITRLSDEMRVTLDDAKDTSTIKAFVDAMNWLDRDMLGNKPSIRFCRIFDRYFSTYFPAQPA